MLSFTLRREGEEDVYFEYSNKSVFGDHQITACTEPQIREYLKWAYIAWGEKEDENGLVPTLSINVQNEAGDNSLIQRKGLGTALYVLACIKAGKRLRSDPNHEPSDAGKGLAEAMDQIDIERILRGDISPEIVGLYAD